MNAVSTRYSVLLRTLIVMGLAVVMACSPESLREGEKETIDAILRSGLEMGDDPFVRAETLRALELIDDARVVELAEPLLDDSSPMVRVAALRLMILHDHPRARQEAMASYNRADDAEKRLIVATALELGSDTLRRTMIGRALRAEDPRQRRMAFEAGPYATVEALQQAGDETTLRRTALPELGGFVEDPDPDIAAMALARLTEAGQPDRAHAFIERFADAKQPLEARLDAGRILVRSRSQMARETFAELLERAGVYDAETLGLPQRRIDPQLVRVAALGLTALGDETYVANAQEYLRGAEVEPTIEVLSALATNPSDDAAVSLRIAMRDAREPVRRAAINLYAARDDAQPDALISAMRIDDFESRKLIAGQLVERFAQAWQETLSARLQNEEQAAETLRTLQMVLRTENELELIVAPLTPRLEALAASSNAEVAALAAYLLLRVDADGELPEAIRASTDPQTRQAYLEYLATSETPARYLDELRANLFEDLFVLRLFAAAGMWRAFPDQARTSATAGADQAASGEASPAQAAEAGSK
ncbi:HEAT repeat domain-containing protein [Lujinxingia sediminis]|uniref:HEAT repeat domain-containing protein n=1 Tax=Lujinxingia sediminis TaxID=2480984 RepID=A0ABY0CVD1_9DELT|nr:HEAT repeat domain-containing protein [Lujinxingia sediminis]RVU46862.1 HEAT repeat domain-containing protein [Lujinxingia sediminis]